LFSSSRKAVAASLFLWGGCQAHLSGAGCPSQKAFPVEVRLTTLMMITATSTACSEEIQLDSGKGALS